MVIRSCAKLNLFLSILKRRPDNYHELDTLFERIDLHDTITLAVRTDTRIRIITHAQGIPRGSKNLAWRAAWLMQKTFRVRQGVDIAITKRIPVGSGMAGGSSNAASVLLGLNKLWRLKLQKAQLIRLAKEIGADVTFFIHDVPFARGRGRGDLIKPVVPLRTVKLWHIIVVPAFGVSTPLAYKKWDEMTEKVGLTRPKTDVKLLTYALGKKDFVQASTELFNSLEQASFQLYPEIHTVKQELCAAGARMVLMSGSGPAVFGIVPSRKEALSIRQKLKVRGSKVWQVFVARTA